MWFCCFTVFRYFSRTRFSVGVTIEIIVISSSVIFSSIFTWLLWIDILRFVSIIVVTFCPVQCLSYHMVKYIQLLIFYILNNILYRYTSYCSILLLWNFHIFETNRSVDTKNIDGFEMKKRTYFTIQRYLLVISN